MSTGEKMNVTLSGNKNIRYNLLIPVIGVTVEVCITEGHIHAYGSLSVPNPNSAFHDFVFVLDLENDTEVCGHAYVVPCAAPTFSPRSRRQTSQSNIDNQVVYLSIVGMAEKNSFIVNGTAGDLYHTETITPGPPDSKTGILNATVFVYTTTIKICDVKSTSQLCTYNDSWHICTPAMFEAHLIVYSCPVSF